MAVATLSLHSSSAAGSAANFSFASQIASGTMSSASASAVFFPAFFAALPILGVDGSLASVERDSPAAGLVHAKTGTVVGLDSQGNPMLFTKALAGYIDTVGNRRLAYALYVNDVPISDIQDVLTANDLLGKISVLIQQTP